MTVLQKLDDIGLLPGAVGLSLVLFMSLSAGQWPPLLLLVGSLLLGMISYVVDRIADGKPGPRWLAPGLTAVVTALFLYELRSGRWLVCLVYVISPLTVFLYSWPLLGKFSSRYRCVKSIPILKSFYVPICWTLPVIFTAAYLEKFPSIAVLPMVLIVFERTFQASTACDFKDISADRASGVITIPVRFGLRPTVWLLHALAAASFIFLMVSVKAGWLNPRMWILGVHYIVFAVCLERMRQPGVDLRHYCGVVDVLYLLWIPLGLFLI